MYNLDGFIESGALSGSSPINFYISHDQEFERRISSLDQDTRKEVRKHLNEFHSVEEMERFINHLTDGESSYT
ncbi:MAG TPA: hypothetical protein VN131_07455 [Mobilitalea sp.]|nr:hypothetical protein [Mobilitalea sp.]